MFRKFFDDRGPTLARGSEMNSFDAGDGSSGYGDARATALRAPAPERHVCPFCGSVNDTLDGPCPRCTMSNTADTRKATKARIGPWYVLQSRNPAAPGMRFETLIGFVRKGRVKARSIVRGPTTHQLWRFASQVKGLSREFGVCYSCGGSIERDAQICSQCNRLQDPPANPDAFIEGQAPAEVPPAGATLESTLEALSAPVFKELKVPAPQVPADAKPQAANATVHEPAVARPAEQRPAPAPVPPPPAPLASAPVPAAEAPRRRPNDVFLSARDLAAAFQLDFEPDEEDAAFDERPSWSASAPAAPARYRRPRRRRRLWRRLVVVFLIALAGAVAAVVLSPPLRARVIAWAQDKYAAVTGADLYRDLSRPGARGTATTAPTTAAYVPPAPARASSRPAEAPAGDTGPAGEVDELTGERLTPPRPAAAHVTADRAPGQDGSAAEDPAEPPAVAPQDAPVSAPAVEKVSPTPEPQARTAGGAADSTPADAPAAPAAPSPKRPATRGVQAAHSTATPAPAGRDSIASPSTRAAAPVPAPRLSPEEALRRSKALYSQAMDAEDRGDYRRAAEVYEQIMSTLPREVWYRDVEARLRLARQQTAADKNVSR